MKPKRLIGLGLTTAVTALLILNYYSGLISRQGSVSHPQNSTIHTQTQKHGEKDLTNWDKLRILKKMFPDKNIIYQNGKFINETTTESEKPEIYYFEKVITGSFINPQKNERLIIIRHNKEDLSHAGVVSNIYLAVFSQNREKLLSGIQMIRADSCEYAAFKGRQLSYLLFIGVITTQGIPRWSVNLWKAGKPWTKKWVLKDAASPGESLPSGISDGGLKVFERVYEKKPNSDPAVPECKLEYRYTLVWDEKTERFIDRKN